MWKNSVAALAVAATSIDAAAITPRQYGYGKELVTSVGSQQCISHFISDSNARRNFAMASSLKR
jgi:hypothetical protein